MKNWLHATLHLLYPQLCVACNAALTASAHQCFCFKCRNEIDRANFDPHDNEVMHRLWGRVPLQAAVALYHFRKKSPVQWALHHLKYSNQPDIGRRLGHLLGAQMWHNAHFRTIDVIVPVPLHPRKERQRGYNQSAAIANGLAEVLHAPVLPHVLARGAYTTSQTRKHRMERFQNVEAVFSMVRPQAVMGKHVLLVDDVLTTGATIETCGNLLASVEGVKISMATIAVTTRGL
jgi:ComF family protein